MIFRSAALLALVLAVTCASAAGRSSSGDGGDSQSLVIGQADDAKKAMDAVPLESAMEKFYFTTSGNHAIAYVGLTDTDYGGLLFVDGKLLGTLSHQDAFAFYSCRGHTTTTQRHWANDADEWVASLVAAVMPTAQVSLQFSGKSTPQSIKEVANNQGLGQLAFLDISTNPLSLFKKLNSAREKMREKDEYEGALNALRSIPIGAGEDKVAETQMPEDVQFVNSGTLVMSYPRFAYEFYVKGGKVALIQQPSFYRIARARPALFYAAGTQWNNCRPDAWRNAPRKTPAAKASGDASNNGGAPKENSAP